MTRYENGCELHLLPLPCRLCKTPNSKGLFPHHGRYAATEINAILDHWHDAACPECREAGHTGFDGCEHIFAKDMKKLMTLNS